MKNSIRIFIFLSPFFITYNALAQQETSGFSGEVSFLSLLLANDSNLSTGADNTKNTTKINSKGDNNFLFIPAALGKISYIYGEQLEHQVFMGTSREDIAVGTLILEAGYQFTLDSGAKIALSYLPTLLKQQVWSDPFAINIDRQETDVYGNAYRLQFKQIDGSPFSVDLAYATTNIDNEESGNAFGLTQAEQNSLARSSNNYYAQVSYRQFLGKGLGITPAFSYLISDAEGKSTSYNQFEAKLSYFSFANRNRIAISLGYQGRIYQAVHPIFSKKREDHELDLFFVYEYGEFFDIPDLSFVALNGLSISNSNIDFYQEKQVIASVGVTYRF